MADSGIKKATILKDDLPIINAQINGYAVRYRIVSDDKNRISAWSPTYYVEAGYTYVSGKISNPNKVGDSVSVVWDRVDIQKDGASIGTIRDYEVWVRWDKGDGGDWKYDGKHANNATFLIPTTYSKNGVDQEQAPNKVSIEVYLESTPVARTTSTTLLRYHIDNYTV